MCIGQGVPIDFLLAILFGWIFYLVRVLPEITVNWDGVATACVCLILFAAGTHVFLRWIQGQRGKSEGSPVRIWRPRWTGGLVGGIVLMFIVGLAAAGIGHQVGWLITSPERLVEGLDGARPAARRALSMNNLKQIWMALSAYNERFDVFPPGGTFDRLGRPIQSWQAMILPYIERKDIWERIDFSLPWDDPRNAAPLREAIPAYLCPGITTERDSAGRALTHYASNVRVLGGDVTRAPKDVTDGGAFTFMAGEVASSFKAWGDPTNWRDPGLGINRSQEGFGSPFPGGANFLFVDGSVRFIQDSIDLRVLEALSTPRGGEAVSAAQY
jgi:prepilin-type processing-associated H-X9-DG protein